MRKAICSLLLIAAMTISCNNNGKRGADESWPQPWETEQADTTLAPTSGDDAGNTVAGKPSASPSAAPSPKSHRDDRIDDDNMRGFDPAFEDDMDDNGMRRYMENDDEEGWD